MDELIKRIEALEAPCRECDCLIAVSVGWDIPNPMAPLPKLVMQFGDEWLLEAATEYNSTYNRLPKFTASIDAAMTLVPEGWGLTLVDAKGHPVEAAIREWQLRDGKYWTSSDMGQSGMVKGATPAIALCIAALKATMP